MTHLLGHRRHHRGHNKLHPSEVKDIRRFYVAHQLRWATVRDAAREVARRWYISRGAAEDVLAGRSWYGINP